MENLTFLVFIITVWILVFEHFLYKPKLAVIHQLFWQEETSKGLLLFTCLLYPPRLAWMDASWPLPCPILLLQMQVLSDETPTPTLTLPTWFSKTETWGTLWTTSFFFSSASIPMFNQSQSYQFYPSYISDCPCLILSFLISCLDDYASCPSPNPHLSYDLYSYPPQVFYFHCH